MCTQLRRHLVAVGLGTPSIPAIARPGDGPCLRARQKEPALTRGGPRCEDQLAGARCPVSPSAGGVVLRPRLRPTPGSPSLVVPLQALAHLLEWARCFGSASGYGTVGAVPFRFKRSGVSQGTSPRRPMARRAGAGPSSCLKGRSPVVSCCACRRTCWVLPRGLCASGRRTSPLPRSRP